jgi:hypothetical protein
MEINCLKKITNSKPDSINCHNYTYKKIAVSIISDNSLNKLKLSAGTFNQ